MEQIMMKPADGTTPPNPAAAVEPAEPIEVQGEADKTLPLENYQVKWAERLGLEKPKPGGRKPAPGHLWSQKKP